MKRIATIMAAMWGLATLPAFAQPAPVDYSRPENWLCRPEAPGACGQSQDATIVAADGTLTEEPWHRASDPKIDCFYVYPTISLDQAGNSDLNAGEQEERYIADQQFARLGSQCRTFAPVYRSVTLTALRAALGGKPTPMDREMAYADVLAAFRYYLAHDNHGRGFVLVGHSQGSSILVRLLKQEVDGKPLQRQLVSALLMGTNLLVPEGKDVGGDLKSIPLCRAARQTGCVIVYDSFRASAPPPDNARFGRTTTPGMMVACVSPAALLGEGDLLKPYYPVSRGPFPNMGATDWVRGKTIPTRWVTLPGLVHGRCVHDAHGSYLAISVTPSPGPRAQDVPGEILTEVAPLPDWGMHPADIHLTMGDLERIVGIEAPAFRR